MNLLKDTKKLMAATDLSLVQMSRGAGVGYWWLQRFKAGSIPEPSVVKVQAVHDYLKKHGKN